MNERRPFQRMKSVLGEPKTWEKEKKRKNTAGKEGGKWFGAEQRHAGETGGSSPRKGRRLPSPFSLTHAPHLHPFLLLTWEAPSGRAILGSGREARQAANRSDSRRHLSPEGRSNGLRAAETPLARRARQARWAGPSTSMGAAGS